MAGLTDAYEAHRRHKADLEQLLAGLVYAAGGRMRVPMDALLNAERHTLSTWRLESCGDIVLELDGAVPQPPPDRSWLGKERHHVPPPPVNPGPPQPEWLQMEEVRPDYSGVRDLVLALTAIASLAAMLMASWAVHLAR